MTRTEICIYIHKVGINAVLPWVMEQKKISGEFSIDIYFDDLTGRFIAKFYHHEDQKAKHYHGISIQSVLAGLIDDYQIEWNFKSLCFK